MATDATSVAVSPTYCPAKPSTMHNALGSDFSGTMTCVEHVESKPPMATASQPPLSFDLPPATGHTRCTLGYNVTLAWLEDYGRANPPNVRLAPDTPDAAVIEHALKSLGDTVGLAQLSVEIAEPAPGETATARLETTGGEVAVLGVYGGIYGTDVRPSEDALEALSKIVGKKPRLWVTKAS
ncbi:hypothetical protein FA95DRAFT_813011 [Auriscalpium vulgare]|uniref:Uncharacterized protein n=1 Tax=Auriscalpium vulgare TaxID=40419 RepID=A0ACB8R9Z2_9AGAM|nr:hypothetical protein FA95DRAFT_813011 [Auriscalpium vulgare]